MSASAEKEKKEVIYSSGSTAEHMAFEQCTGPKGESGYAVYYHMDNEVHFQTGFSNLDETTEYMPIEKPLWPLAKFPEDSYRIPAFTQSKAVFEEVRDFIYAYVELPHQTLYDVLALWVLSSYLKEKFDSVPYLCFIGPKDSGKTRALEALAELSYRGLLSPSFSSAGLFRTIEKYGPTLFLDEAEIYGQEQKTEAIAVLNAGYRKGQFIIRVNPENNECEGFSCFGQKALASTNIFVPTIESRAIVVNMRRNVRDLPLFIDKERAATLRLMLLIYRFNVLQEKEAILDDKEKILSFLPVRHGRIAELFYPLVSVAPAEEVRQKTAEYAKQVYVRRQEEEKASVEAALAQALLECQDQVESGKLSIQAITDMWNLGKPERQQWKPTSIGRALARLGFSPTRIGTKGQRAIFNDTNLLGYLAVRYGYTPKQMSETSELSANMECYVDGNTDRTDSSDIRSEASPSLDDLTSVYMTVDYSMKQCGICKLEKITCQEAVTNRGLVIAICDQCSEAYQKQRDSI